MQIAASTRAQAKALARILRAISQTPITHAQALEQVAAELGFRDWNTAAARLPERDETGWRTGDRVCGYYLKQPFEGVVYAVQTHEQGSGFHLTLQFDQAVDVVQWDSFSAYRQRVTSNIDNEGVSKRRTSDGAPHLLVYRQPNAARVPRE